MSENHNYDGPKNNEKMLEKLTAFVTHGTEALQGMAREFNAHVQRQVEASAYRVSERAKAIPSRANEIEKEFYAVLRAGFEETAAIEFDAKWPAPEVPQMIDLQSLADFESFAAAENARLAKANAEQKAASTSARAEKAAEAKRAQEAAFNEAVEKRVAETIEALAASGKLGVVTMKKGGDK